jgi:prevent-host-death family protein
MLEVSMHQAGQTLPSLIDQIILEKRPIIITEHGKSKAVLLSIEEYNRLTQSGGICAEALAAAQRLREALATRTDVLQEDWVAAARAARETALFPKAAEQ